MLFDPHQFLLKEIRVASLTLKPRSVRKHLSSRDVELFVALMNRWRNAVRNRNVAYTPAVRTRPREAGARSVNERVRECIAKMIDRAERVTRDAIASRTGVSSGSVSASQAWRAFRSKQRQDSLPSISRSDTVPSNIDEAIDRCDWEVVREIQKRESQSRR
jgi:hypothetical protein